MADYHDMTHMTDYDGCMYHTFLRIHFLFSRINIARVNVCSPPQPAAMDVRSPLMGRPTGSVVPTAALAVGFLAAALVPTALFVIIQRIRIVVPINDVRFF